MMEKPSRAAKYDKNISSAYTIETLNEGYMTWMPEITRQLYNDVLMASLYLNYYMLLKNYARTW